MRTHDNGPRPTRPRRLRPLLAIALGDAVLAAIPSVTATTPERAWTPMTPVTQDHGLRLDQSLTARGRLLGINDFHGALEPPTGSGGRSVATGPQASGPRSPGTRHSTWSPTGSPPRSTPTDRTPWASTWAIPTRTR